MVRQPCCFIDLVVGSQADRYTFGSPSACGGRPNVHGSGAIGRTIGPRLSPAVLNVPKLSVGPAFSRSAFNRYICWQAWPLEVICFVAPEATVFAGASVRPAAV